MLEFADRDKGEEEKKKEREMEIGGFGSHSWAHKALAITVLSH